MAAVVVGTNSVGENNLMRLNGATEFSVVAGERARQEASTEGGRLAPSTHNNSRNASTATATSCCDQPGQHARTRHLSLLAQDASQTLVLHRCCFKLSFFFKVCVSPHISLVEEECCGFNQVLYRNNALVRVDSRSGADEMKCHKFQKDTSSKSVEE